ncbi:hypothetical protein JTB14_034912 [Gonioctena quinquepunctata]|nr:hypothetical protein JTB14_034912 [Gonioctena quinquepunctata]
MENGVSVADRGHAVKSYILTLLDDLQNDAQTLYNEAQIETRNARERISEFFKIKKEEIFEIYDNSEDFQNKLIHEEINGEDVRALS